MERKQTVLLVLAVCVAFALAYGSRSGRADGDSLEEAAYGGPLSGITVAIDPGHGGYDQGCVGARGTLEAPLNLDVSLRVRAALKEMGANVVLTRESDDSLVDPDAQGNRKKQDMALREALILENGAQMLLSIHMNAYSGRGPSGALVYYREGSGEGKALGDAVQGAFHEADARHKQRAQAGDYYILGCVDAAVLIECGFLSNPREEALLNTEPYRQQVAETIARGVAAYWHPM